MDANLRRGTMPRPGMRETRRMHFNRTWLRWTSLSQAAHRIHTWTATGASEQELVLDPDRTWHEAEFQPVHAVRVPSTNGVLFTRASDS